MVAVLSRCEQERSGALSASCPAQTRHTAGALRSRAVTQVHYNTPPASHAGCSVAVSASHPAWPPIGICHGATHVSYLLSDLALVPVCACEQVSELELQGWGWLAQRLSRVFGAVQSLDRNSADKGSLRRYNSSHEAHSLAPPPSTAPCVRCLCYADVWRAPICGARGTSDALAAHTWCKSGGCAQIPTVWASEVARI
eukprot:SAG25_NODE_1015_length_4296_cov_1.949964_4_plen_198_part_00